MLSSSLINILRLLYLLKFYLPLILPEEQINFKIRNYYYNLISCNYQKCRLKILKVVVNIFSTDN